MWYGKCAIIMTIFSFASLFSMYFISTLEPTSDMASNPNWNLAQVQKLATSLSALTNLNAGQSPNPALLFGDFLVGATVLFSVLSGGGVTTILQGIPGFSITMLYLVQIVYGSSCALLWVYVISNRSL
jgi:hypothetical protein